MLTCNSQILVRDFGLDICYTIFDNHIGYFRRPRLRRMDVLGYLITPSPASLQEAEDVPLMTSKFLNHTRSSPSLLNRALLAFYLRPEVLLMHIAKPGQIDGHRRTVTAGSSPYAGPRSECDLAQGRSSNRCVARFC